MPKRKLNETVEKKVEKKVKKFRMQYKTVGLTYSRFPHGREKVLEFLSDLHYGIEEYYIVQEEHKEEKGCPYHIHAWFKFMDKPNITSERYFDIPNVDDPSKPFHPNVGKKKKNWIHNYLKKFDKTPLTNIPDGYVQLAINGKLKEAEECFRLLHSKEYVMNLQRVRTHLKMLSKKEKKMKIYPFTGDVVDWDFDQKSLVIVGLTDQGKTEWAKSFIHHHFKQTFLFATHLDSLKKYDGQEWIIYDDIHFGHLPRTTQIHIAEVVNERSIHCRHVCADIPPGIRQIFLCNEFCFGHDPAVLRRLKVIDLVQGTVDMRLTPDAPSIRFY